MATDPSTGIWIGENLQNYHKYDSNLAEGLSDFFEQEGGNVVDMGCGYGEYVEKISEVTECVGYDGNPFTENITQGLCKVLDLSKKQNIRKSDWVLSLEVGNHIPRDFEDVFIDNLHNTNKKGIIISWASESQKGAFQLNKRDGDYIVKKFKDLGYTYDSASSNILKKKARFFWFRNTLKVFRK